eukprot:CAMPEP_0172382676 /NCGR_PEP_ID=MMETSP1061-20121228/608_1 /TAXON_ID=37318 /ORGANISM="Pseudo-nitzschia pungens, Strain cf. pungens" /LENGTH=471 /DNA_ID=CAMNT_0013110641 /DNA_START=100 /DNA_END=1515 /DNA_ORIENTATION=+
MNSSTSNIIGDRDPSHVKSLDKSKLNDKHGDDNADADPPSDSKAAVSTDKAKRFLPAYKKANAALTFPEKMMNLMKYVDEKNKTEKDFCISWLPEGKAFVIYNIKEFTSSVIPKFFKASKFCSFTRKLYRWGFRQLNRGIGPDEPIIFGNEYFQRDNADLMVNMRSITAASIRKRESDLLRHMLASKKRSLLSDPTGGYVSHQDTKQYNMAAQFDQKQNASRVANVLASQQRFGGGSGAADGCYSTNLSHLNNQELQMMYQSIVDPTRKSGNGADGGIVPIISDAMSQMSNPYSNFGSGGSSHQQDFNAMTSMHMGNNSSGSSSMMAGPTSNFISSQTGNNSSFDSVSGNGTNSRMNNMGNSYGNNGMGFNSAFNNNIFSSADSMYGNNSSRGGGNFNLSQQFSNSGTNCDIGNSRKNLMNHGGKHNYDNGNYSNFNNTPMNMNINQQLFNLSSSTVPGAGSEDLYFSGQY